jgi:hypothetical protein
LLGSLHKIRGLHSENAVVVRHISSTVIPNKERNKTETNKTDITENLFRTMTDLQGRIQSLDRLGQDGSFTAEAFQNHYKLLISDSLATFLLGTRDNLKGV